MVGLVEALDSIEGVVNGYALIVDVWGIADDTRDGSKPACHPHRARIGKGRQTSLEHPRIELIGFAVDVHVTAGEMRAHHRVAAFNDAEHEFVDKGVFR